MESFQSLVWNILWEFENNSSLPPYCESQGIWQAAWCVLYLYLFPVGQRKARDVADSADKPKGNKPSDSGDKNAKDTSDQLDENKKDNKPGDQKKEDQTAEKPVPAVEPKKVEEHEFHVRVCLCVCLYDLFMKSISNFYLLLAEEHQATDFSFGQSWWLLQLQCKSLS